MQERYSNFTVLMAKITRSIKRIKTEEMEEYNLKGNHLSCIYYLHKLNSLTLAELCDICKEDKASLSRSVDDLVSKGIVERDDNNTYRNLLTLSVKGSSVGSKISAKIDAVLDAASVGIDEENRTIMYQCLSQISKNLDNYCKKFREE